MKKFIREIFKKYNFELTDTQVNQFDIYIKELKEANEKFNITAITDNEEIVIKHFLDSVMISKYKDMSNVKTMIDIGTGGGFPGLPLKILFPNIKVTLLDSLNKRITFLNELIRKLELTNIEAIHGRSEELGCDIMYREKYDLAVSRAVAYLNILSEYSIPFVKPDGYFIPLKKSELEEEVGLGKNAIKVLGGKIEKIETYKLDEIDMFHSLVFIKKIKSTDKKYPRSNKQIKQKGL